LRLFLLKRDHQEGQTIYGVFESGDLARQQIDVLKQDLPNVSVSDYIIKVITLNELTEIEAYE
jgi:hypothetical protein